MAEQEQPAGARKPALSFDDYAADPDMREDFVETPRGTVHLASCTAEDMVEWLEGDEDPETGKYDPERGKMRWLRLLVLSWVNPDGTRIPRDQRAAALEKLRLHDATVNGRLTRTARELAGLARGVAQLEDRIKKESVGAGGGGSPTTSPTTTAALT